MPVVHVAVGDKLAAVIVDGRAERVTHDDKVVGKSALEATAAAAPHTTNGLTELAVGQVVVVVPHDVTIVGNETKPGEGLVLVYFTIRPKMETLAKIHLVILTLIALICLFLPHNRKHMIQNLRRLKQHQNN